MTVFPANNNPPHTRAARSRISRFRFTFQRPARFYRGHDAYDFEGAEFVSDSADEAREGFLFETQQKGECHSDHRSGTKLTVEVLRRLSSRHESVAQEDKDRCQ